MAGFKYKANFHMINSQNYETYPPSQHNDKTSNQFSENNFYTLITS